MEYLDAPDEASQGAIINDGNRDACVYMTRTKWLRLEAPSARYDALCHVLALVRWYDAQNGSRDEAGDHRIGCGDSDDEVTGSDMDTDG